MEQLEEQVPMTTEMRDWRTSPVLVDECWVFMHLPKTGGKTFSRRVLDTLTPNKVLAYNPWGDGMLPVDALPSWVLGHNPLSWYGYHGTTEHWCTIFREPLQRYYSHLRHFWHREHARDILNIVRNRRMSNIITRMLSANKLGNTYQQEEPNLDVALSRLDRLKIIGRTDRMEAFVSAVEAASGITLATAENVNVSPDQRTWPQYEDEIRERNHMDFALWDAVKEMAV